MGFSIPSKSHNHFYLKLKVSSPKITFEAHAQISLAAWSFNISRPTHGHLTGVRARGARNLNVVRCGRKFEPELSRLSTGIMFYLLTRRCLKIQSSLS